MTIIIFADNDGCARSIRGNCIQPSMHDNEIDSVQSNAIYTAVMEVWYV